MNSFDREIQRMAQNEETQVPENVKKRIEDTLSALPDKKSGKIITLPKALVSAVCAAAIALFVLPNVSMTYARAASRIPIIGDIIRVCTVRSYDYSDAEHELHIKVPGVEGADEVNRSVDELTREIVDNFYSELGQGYKAVYADHETLADSESWFTLKLTVSQAEGGGYTYYRYYNIDKTTGEYVKLGDLFADESWADVISDELIRQMRADQDAGYLIGDGGFTGIDRERGFYFDADGDLVIPFDEYEIASGAQGCPEFQISRDVYSDMLDAHFAEILG